MKNICVVIFILSWAMVAQAEVSMKTYGFFKIDLLVNDRELDADHKPFYVVSDNGKTQREKDLLKGPRSQVSIKQTRFGMAVDSTEGWKGKLEFDLDGEDGNSSGVISSSNGFLRLRHANVQIPLGQGLLTLGKKQDLFSPLFPHTYYYTEVHFWSGNNGFFTDGVEYVQNNENWGWGLELKNFGADRTTLKLSSPAVAARLRWEASSGHVFFLSGIAGTLVYRKQDVSAPFDDQDRGVNGVSLSYSGKFADSLELISEFYSGRNLGAAVTGSLVTAPKSQASTSSDGGELGGYLSAKAKMGYGNIFGGFGVVRIKEQDDSVTQSRTAGLMQNELSRIGYDWTTSSGVIQFVEINRFETTYLESNQKNRYVGHSMNLGMVLKF